MAVPKLTPRYTVDEYLAFERASIERHEYLDGRIISMVNESLQHNEATTNIVVSIGYQLNSVNCRLRTKDLKIVSGAASTDGTGKKGLFSYPDIVAVVGKPEYRDAFRDTLLNPKVILEVLSKSTEASDRGEKFQRYQMHNPSLQDYILVSQNRPQVDHFQRRPVSGWTYRHHSGLSASFTIESIGCELKLATVYHRIDLESDPANAE
jgi:Uma2 family endonuclease